MRIWLLLIVGLSCSIGYPQTTNDIWKVGLRSYWDGINAEYRDSLHSPLLPHDRLEFDTLERFPPDKAYCVIASFTEAQGEAFGMPTTTDRRPMYQPVGRLSFNLLEEECELTVYRNIELSKDSTYSNYLFVPFTDLTNGDLTYGGGRYVDLEGPLGTTVELDLNRAYNPYCAYGGKYSCPIPPKANDLKVRVMAGVLKFEH